MIIPQLFALFGIILFFSSFVTGQLFPYQTGIGLGSIILAFVLAFGIKIFNVVSSTKGNDNPTQKKHISVGAIILIVGILIGLLEWTGVSGSEGFDDIAVSFLAYLLIFIGGMLMLFKK